MLCSISAGKGITNISSRPNVLIAYRGEDKENAYRLAGLLTREEINTEVTADCVSAVKTPCARGERHLIILRDNCGSFGYMETLRRLTNVPILTVSDNCDEIYRTLALSKGADMCIDAGETGSFEFKARVIALLRRSIGAPSTVEYIPEPGDILKNGSICIDRRRREIYSGGVPVRMTAIEYGIVEYLMENCGRVCTVDDIYRRVWNETPYSVRKTVVEHIRRIRCKIEPDPHNPSYIKVVFGVGYKMEKAG